jgi:cobyrinic acid a,c-diamide synthase
MSHILISATRKSSGKTTIALGIAAALAKTGLQVQTFKKGPDYIDPMWLSRATARPCRNLDYYTMSQQEIMNSFSYYSHRAEFSLIEGNKGLFDGLDLDGSNSNAALATLLDAPIVLVIDTGGMTRGIAPLILGYLDFDPALNIAGVILNKVGGARHEKKLRAIVEHYTDVPVLGVLHRDIIFEIPERHLGLTPTNESPEVLEKINTIASLIEEKIDLDAIKEIANKAVMLPIPAPVRIYKGKPDIRIGIARDSAFGFYYPGDLEALEESGATLVNIDMTKDTILPKIDGLFIGGGFPETQMVELKANSSMMDSVRKAIERGLPTYAECGGLMYLARSITWQGKTQKMAGVIAGDIVMHDKPQGRGYVRLRETGKAPWPLKGVGEIPAHEFHYSSLKNLEGNFDFAYEMLRGHGIDGKHDGLIYKNLLAGFSHLRDVEANSWAARFANFVRLSKKTQIQKSPERGTA